MCQTFLFIENSDALQKSITHDIEALVFLNCNDSKHEEINCGSEKGGDVVIAVAMMILCLSFLSIFTVPIMLENELGLVGARAAIESVEFQIFAVMNSLSFFSSMGVVMVMIQAMGMKTVTPAFMKSLRSMCGTVTHIGMGSAAIAFISAAAALTRRLE